MPLSSAEFAQRAIKANSIGGALVMIVFFFFFFFLVDYQTEL